jgi:hypothetical protein
VSRPLVFGAVLIAALLLSLQLLVPPIIGVANNGDFDRVMSKVGLRYIGTTRSENYVDWVLTKFALVEPARQTDSYTTSETPLAWLAVRASRTFSGGGLFDIRFLGAIHIVLLLVALAGLALACGDLAASTRWMVMVMLVLLFTDVGYAAPLNSLYPQAASFLFFMLAAAFAATAVRRGRLGGGLLVCYFVAAALFVSSRPQETIQGPFLAVLGVGLAGALRKGWWRQPAVWLALGLCVLSAVQYRRTPDWLRQLALYDTLFREVLLNSPDPAKDLAELGLDPALARHSGRSPYPLDSPFQDPAFKAAVFGKFGYGSLLKFYVAHPDRLQSLVVRTAPSALQIRPLFLANYSRESGRPARTQTPEFAWWSNFRRRFEPGAHVLFPLFFFGNLVAALGGYRRASERGRLFRQAVAVLVLMATLEFFVALLADIPGDIARHLYVFHAMCDLLVIADVAWILEILARRARVKIGSPGPLS